MKATDLTDEQREEFANAFYDQCDIEDQDTPCPWGCPWLHGYTVELRGSTISTMAKNWFMDSIVEIEGCIADQVRGCYD